MQLFGIIDGGLAESCLATAIKGTDDREVRGPHWQGGFTMPHAPEEGFGLPLLN